MPTTTQIKNRLDDAWQAGKISHAYIVSGGTGDDRREVADYIAELLLARGSANEEIGMKQLSCKTHPDLMYVTHEKPASISVDDIRRQLSDTIDIRPYETKNKLYIVDESEKMTVQAQNAVLKTIEEPPEYACIVLLTDNPEFFLETIRSRCVSLKITVEESEDTISEEYAGILRNLTAMKTEDIMRTAASLKDDKDDLLAFIDAARLWLRDVLVLKVSEDETMLLLSGEADDEKKYAKALKLEDIERALSAVDEAESRIESNVNAELTLQMMLMKLVNK